MLSAVLLSLLSLLVIGWMLYTNANDRKRFEKQLERALLDDAGDGDAQR